MYGGLDTIIPPSTEGHNWNTFSMQPNPSNLCKSSNQSLSWKVIGNNLSLYRLVTRKEMWETVLEFRMYYQRYREITSNLLRCESGIEK